MKKKSNIYMKFSEKEIQEEIWKHRENLFEWIDEPKFKKKNPQRHNICSVLYSNIMEEYKSAFDSISRMDLFGDETRLEKIGDSTIRADFLGALGGDNGLVVCELKKSNQTERQAFTELMAYANHLRNKFAPMGRRDIMYLLIAPMEERIVREAVLNTILYDRNRILALIPYFTNEEDISTLRFKVWMPLSKDFDILGKTAFAPQNMDVFKAVWQGDKGIWSPRDENSDPSEDMIRRLNRVASYTAQLMEANGINGFVFSSQQYPEYRKKFPLDNAVIICAINPFAAAKTKILYEHGEKLNDSAEVSMECISIYNMIPHLRKSCPDINDHNNYLYDLWEGWASNITSIGLDVVKLLTKKLTSKFVRTDRGSFTWKDYVEHQIEDKGCWNYDIYLTGLLRELYVEWLLQNYYNNNALDSEQKESLIDTDESKEYFIDMINSQYHVREFLKIIAGKRNSSRIKNPLKDEVYFYDTRFEWDSKKLYGEWMRKILDEI